MMLDVLHVSLLLAVIPLMSWLIMDSVEKGTIKAFHVFTGVICGGLLIYILVASLKPGIFG